MRRVTVTCTMRPCVRFFHSQHRTPVVPQATVNDPPSSVPIAVGYLLHRNQVVKQNPHPLETEMSYLLEREHQRYSRHETSESATHFMSARAQTMDLLGRSESNQIRGNFFGLELYQDAMRVMLQRYKPEPRVTESDLWNPADLTDKLPVRHTLSRKLDDYLYFIIQEEATGKWTIPSTLHKEKESLRMTLDRALSEHHRDGLDCYVWSNAPQCTVTSPTDTTRLFVYAATYLSGRPHFDSVEPRCKDHAWVTRSEMRQYLGDFKDPHLLEALLDISADASFEQP